MTGSSKMVRVSLGIVALIIIIGPRLDRFLAKCGEILQMILVKRNRRLVGDRPRADAQSATGWSQRDGIGVRGKELGNRHRPLEPFVVEPCGAQAFSPRERCPVAQKLAFLVRDS